MNKAYIAGQQSLENLIQGSCGSESNKFKTFYKTF